MWLLTKSRTRATLVQTMIREMGWNLKQKKKKKKKKKMKHM
jgi:hypothetical protein